MHGWWWLIVGIVASGPLWVAGALLASRRTWRSARKLFARARGQEQLVELRQLAGGLAHEIKNPLSTINVNLKLLSEDLGRLTDDEHRRWLLRLESVQHEADRLKGILDDFLRFAGKHELDLAVMDVRRLAGELVDFFTPQAEAAGVVMRTALPEEVLCLVDANLIKQALLNLMINAVQAMAGPGELLIRAGRHRDEGVVEIIDTGPGMQTEELAKIFQAYYSTKQGGSGLGLPTTRRIVREHHGTIRVESEPGKGTRFIVALPLAKDQDT